VGEAKRELLRQALSSLGDETKFKLVKLLLEEGPASAGDLTVKLDRARSTVDEHLEELMEVGLVSRRRLDRKFLYEATELAKLCLSILEGKESVEGALEALPSQAEVEVKVFTGPLRPSVRLLASRPGLVSSMVILAGLAARPLAPWLDLRALMALLGLGYGVADARGVLRVGRRDVAAACVAAALLTSIAASLTVVGHGLVEAFLVGFLLYLAWYSLAMFIPFEAVRLLWRR